MQDPSDVGILIRRVDALEKDNRRFRFCILVLLLSICAVLVMGAGSERGETLEARQINLYDSSGSIRVSIGTGPNGAQIELSDSLGQRRILLASEHETLRGKAMPRQTAPTIVLTDSTEGPGLSTVALQSHFVLGSGLFVWDNRERPVVELGVWEEVEWGRAPQLQLHDLEGSARRLMASVINFATFDTPGPRIYGFDERGDGVFRLP